MVMYARAARAQNASAAVNKCNDKSHMDLT